MTRLPSGPRPPASIRSPAARATRVALVALLVLGVPACTGGESAPAGSDDTSEVASDLLTSPEAASSGQAARTGGLPGTPRSDIPLAVLGHTEGDPDAPLQIVEFSDFGCGYCRQFHLQTYPALHEEYVESGKAVWKYVPIVLGMFGPTAEDAAEAGECALEQGRFPAMRDRIFQEQSEWKGSRDPVPLLREYAEEEGLDVEQWDRCMEADARWDRIATGTAIAARLGLRGTPTFYIADVGTIPGAVPLEIFRQVLDTAYVEVTRESGPDAGPPPASGG